MRTGNVEPSFFNAVYSSPVIDFVWDGDNGVNTHDNVSYQVAASLADSLTYYWRVRYRDSQGMWSAYSVETSFRTCALAPDCSDGIWCNGDEACGDHVCRPGSRNCWDGLACTADRCDEDIDGCVHEPDDGMCSDGAWCSGAEIWDPAVGCRSGPPPCTGDGTPCTLDTCNEDDDQCGQACGATGRWDPCCHDPACDQAAVCAGAPGPMPWIDLLLLSEE